MTFSTVREGGWMSQNPRKMTPPAATSSSVSISSLINRRPTPADWLCAKTERLRYRDKFSPIHGLRRCGYNILGYHRCAMADRRRKIRSRSLSGLRQTRSGSAIGARFGSPVEHIVGHAGDMPRTRDRFTGRRIVRSKASAAPVRLSMRTVRRRWPDRNCLTDRADWAARPSKAVCDRWVG